MALKTNFVPVAMSLADLCGEGFIDAVCRARAYLNGEPESTLRERANARVDFFPRVLQARLLTMLNSVGEGVISPVAPPTSPGASTDSFNRATNTALAPLNGLGPFRVGENGILYLTTKSEHYHTSMGHRFPGYDLIEHARQLGIPNATHNNTRGHITRLLERALVIAANGNPGANWSDLGDVPETRRLDVLNRVLNLETGSLAVEAALKMTLARFYRVQNGLGDPRYAGKTPVVLVVGDDTGGTGGNYHGTTIFTQIMRGMWHELAGRLAGAEAFQVRAIRPNNHDDLDRAFAELNTDSTRVAGFFHEIVMMNYGGLVLQRDFLRHAYDLCAQHDVPVTCDEIQSCIWNPEIFMFREYGIKPTFVSVGKGFPGGEYPASRIIFSAAMDNDLPQFGALVTNGQEELASLSYLITLAWARANAEVTSAVGDYFAEQLRALSTRHRGLLTGVNGCRHMSTIQFADMAAAKNAATALVAAGLDVSVQSYKVDCPPAILMKLPLIAGYEIVDFVVEKFDRVLRSLSIDRDHHGSTG